MKLKSITLALSFVAVSAVVANTEVTVETGLTSEHVTVHTGTTNVEVTTDGQEAVVVSVSTPEPKEVTAEQAAAPQATEEATVSTEEVAN
jgi:hypothetical protein